MTLLPKKGDHNGLKNWRPIALINTDAKVFIHLLNERLMPHMNRLISPYQLGFMPGCFIGENGKLLHTVMADAESSSSTAVGLLLDQAKAYDRIHPDYLQQAMSAFGIPDPIITSLSSLFFSTAIRTNINGHISQQFIQKRGLRQGGPISPLLFNIAFDSFLRALSTNTAIQGYQFFSRGLSDASTRGSLEPIKVLAYADDTLVLLNSTSDMSALLQIITLYERSFNAKLNYSKAQKFSLSLVFSRQRGLTFYNNFLHQLHHGTTERRHNH
ncbi:hypothetical protein RMATCC62417_18097 [Rhizopus microsporus]|nr:hypothetical protein RMATCC62417_18097 [Rhizopus microsporus]